jgi:hypothetical protein
MNDWDATNEDIGTVKFVQMGDEDPTNYETEAPSDQRPVDSTNSLFDEVIRAFAPDHDLPDALIKQMRRYGFIRIDGGLLRADYIATHDQIADAHEDGVRLNVPQDRLFKL